MKALIVKASSLGDIIQTLGAVEYLKDREGITRLDWAIDEAYRDFISSCSLIDNAYSFNFKRLKRFYLPWNLSAFFKFIKKLRKTRYDVVFDLQGNSKSSLITFFSKAKDKVGFAKKCVREKINTISTNIHFYVKKDSNIRYQYISLVKQYFKDSTPSKPLKPIILSILDEEDRKLKGILDAKELKADFKMMVCPGSRWENKMLYLNTLKEFMKLVDKNLNASFLLVWGNDNEKKMCEELHSNFKYNSFILDKINVPIWQNLMDKMSLVLAMDSSSLHLCSTSSAKSYGVFGPTKADILKPLGDNHLIFQGRCPFNIEFKQFCPILRKCKSGACVKNITANELYSNLINFLKSFN